MSKILILPDSVASKIAAGEVVQRPESVVKELIENSLDSGAKKVTLAINNAGKNLVQVIDNGNGMSAEDALISLKRHSTSKIKEISDLDSLNTFGFRGEALFSISSVSRMEIKTKEAESELGTQIIVEGGDVLDFSAANCETGTSISVKNLFFNIPARRKFLKSNATEFKHIYDTWQRLAFIYPDRHFVLISDNQLIKDIPASSLEKRIQDFYGNTFFNSLIPVDYSNELLSVYGYIGSPRITKKTKGDQFLYLNNRYVVNKSINHAIYKAYEHLIDHGDFPFYMLFIQVDLSKVDLNVHPSKLEVKFDNEYQIYSSVNSAVKSAISKVDLSPVINLLPGINPDDKIRLNVPQVEQKADIIRTENPGFQSRNYSGESWNNNPGFHGNKVFKTEQSFPSGFNEILPDVAMDLLYRNEEKDEKSFTKERVIWQLHNKYILTPIKNGLLIIDQHIAHERILYEKILNDLEANLPFSQQLLFKETIVLTEPDYRLLSEIIDILERIGFDIKLLNENKIIINGVPQEVKIGQEKDTLVKILEQYREFSSVEKLEQKDNIAKSFSCTTAIKAGDELTNKEMLSLIDNLFACKVPNVCPHGRPVLIKLTIDELDRRFGRTIVP